MQAQSNVSGGGYVEFSIVADSDETPFISILVQSDNGEILTDVLVTTLEEANELVDLATAARDELSRMLYPKPGSSAS